MLKLGGSKLRPTGKGILRGDYELVPRFKPFGTWSALGSVMDLLGLEGVSGHLQTKEPDWHAKKVKSTSGEHKGKLLVGRARGGGNGGASNGSPGWGGGQWGTMSARCWCSPVIPAGKGWGISTTALWLLPDFGSPLLTVTQSPELCSHIAHMWVLISTSMDTALHVCVSGTPECQPQRGSVRISTMTGLTFAP